MELRQLEYFAAVARHRHFTRASRELHIAQPALSQQIKRLEAELGLELLRRSTRRVEVTAAGEVLLSRAQRALGEIEAARQELSELTGLLKGRVEIGSLPLSTLGLPSVLGEFRASHPGVSVGLHEQALSVMLPMLRRDELDLCFAMTRSSDAGAEVDGRLLFEEEMVAVLSPGHRLAERRRIRLAELSGEPLLGFRPGSVLRRVVDEALAAAGVSAPLAYESFELETLRELASHGLGIAFLARGYVEREGPPVKIVAVSPQLRIPVSLIWRAGRRRPPAAEAFLDFARKRLTRI